MVSRLMLSTGIGIRQLAILNRNHRDPLSRIIGGDDAFCSAASSVC